MESNYYGVLPFTVRHDGSLHDKDKLIYTELTALINKEGFVIHDTKLDNHFLKYFDVSRRVLVASFQRLERSAHVSFIKENKIYLRR